LHRNPTYTPQPSAVSRAHHDSHQIRRDAPSEAASRLRRSSVHLSPLSSLSQILCVYVCVFLVREAALRGPSGAVAQRRGARPMGRPAARHETQNSAPCRASALARAWSPRARRARRTSPQPGRPACARLPPGKDRAAATAHHWPPRLAWCESYRTPRRALDARPVDPSRQPESGPSPSPPRARAATDASKMGLQRRQRMKRRHADDVSGRGASFRRGRRRWPRGMLQRSSCSSGSFQYSHSRARSRSSG